MDLFDTLPEIVRNNILLYLTSKDLAKFSKCCKSWREYTNQDKFWHRFCYLEGLIKFEYLLDNQAHSCVPLNSSPNNISPIFKLPEYETIINPCRWKIIYAKAKHLIKNWRSGYYTVGPILKGHKGRISAFDSDGSFIVSGSSDEKLVKVWSIEDSECIYTIKSHLDSINSIKINKNMFILGGDDGIIRIYELSSGDLIKKIILNDIQIMKLYTYDNRLIAILSDKSIRVWSLKTFEIIQILRGHEDEIECLHFYENFIISGSWDTSIGLWSVNHSKRLLIMKEHSEVVSCIKMKNNLIVSGSFDSTLKIWKVEVDPNSKNKTTFMLSDEVKTLKGHKSDVYCLDFNDDYIASSGSDSKVLIWDFNTTLLHQLDGHLGVVRYIFIDDFKLVSGGDSKKIIIWDYKKGKLLNTLYRNPNRLHLMWINDTKILTASPENESNITTIFYW